jgi:hypothetical protein
VSESLAIYLSYYTALVTIVRPAIVAAILIGLWIALRRTRFGSDAQLATWFAVAIPLVAWLAIIWSVAASGALQARPSAVPLLPFALVLPVAIGLVSLMRSERIAAAADTASQGWLIGLQIYRIIGANFVVLWALGGAIPGVFAIPAGFGDMLVGALALPVAFYVASGAAGGRTAGVAWNILGIADLVLAVSLGFLSSPGPLQIIALDQPNVLATTYPTVMTPAFAVPLSLILHGLSLWQLRRRTGRRERLTLAPAK